MKDSEATATHTIVHRGLEAIEFLETSVHLQRGEGPTSTGRLGLTPLTIGSEPGNGLVSDDPGVSRKHCVVMRDEQGFRVRDLKSKNGLRIDGVRVLDAFLAPNQVVELGGSRLWLTVSSSATEVALATTHAFGEVLGGSLPMRALFKILERAAPTDSTVLLLGETGTGKDAIARGLHTTSARREGPFVVCDCSTLAPSLIESELFGHVQGAFTGASRSREGLFGEAHGGTLFLDEVGELPLELQSRLLRVLEARVVRAVGASSERAVDVRIIAATHRDLRDAVSRGTFRQDLYFRLGVLEVKVPALRERLEDLPMLVQAFLERQEPPLRLTALPPNTLRLLEAYDWPGNVRELRNVVERLAITRSLEGLGTVSSPLQPWHDARAAALVRFEVSHLKKALLANQGNLAGAARALGVSRQFVHQLVTRHDL